MLTRSNRGPVKPGSEAEKADEPHGPPVIINLKKSGARGYAVIEELPASNSTKITLNKAQVFNQKDPKTDKREKLTLPQYSQAIPGNLIQSDRIQASQVQQYEGISNLTASVVAQPETKPQNPPQSNNLTMHVPREPQHSSTGGKTIATSKTGATNPEVTKGGAILESKDKKPQSKDDRDKKAGNNAYPYTSVNLQAKISHQQQGLGLGQSNLYTKGPNLNTNAGSNSGLQQSTRNQETKGSQIFADLEKIRSGENFAPQSLSLMNNLTKSTEMDKQALMIENLQTLNADSRDVIAGHQMKFHKEQRDLKQQYKQEMLGQQGLSGGYQSTGMREQYSKDANFLPSSTAHYLGPDDSGEAPMEDAQHSSNMVGAKFDGPGVHDGTNALGPTQVSIVAHEPKKYYVSQKEKLAQQREQSQVIFF